MPDSKDQGLEPTLSRLDIASPIKPDDRGYSSKYHSNKAVMLVVHRMRRVLQCITINNYRREAGGIKERKKKRECRGEKKVYLDSEGYYGTSTRAESACTIAIHKFLQTYIHIVSHRN